MWHERTLGHKTHQQLAQGTLMTQGTLMKIYNIPIAYLFVGALN